MADRIEVTTDDGRTVKVSQAAWDKSYSLIPGWSIAEKKAAPKPRAKKADPEPDPED